MLLCTPPPPSLSFFIWTGLFYLHSIVLLVVSLAQRYYKLLIDCDKCECRVMPHLARSIQYVVVKTTIVKMIVIVKSSGCLQIGFGPLIIDYICIFFYFTLLTPDNQIQITHNCVFCTVYKWRKKIKLCYKIRDNFKQMWTHMGAK